MPDVPAGFGRAGGGPGHLAGRFAWLAGAPQRLASSAKAVRTFCGICGTPLSFSRRAGPGTVDVTLVSLADPAAVPPQRHIWTMSRLPRMDTADSLPRHAGGGDDPRDG